MSDLPIGAVCPFPGQVSPITGEENSIWSSSDCGNSNAQPGEESSASPVIALEGQGWMLCDGRVLSTTQYPELYGVLGILYGEATTESGDEGFVLPDYRGLFLRGNDAGAGLDPDAASRIGPTGEGTANVVGSLQCDAFQDHTHNYDTETVTAMSDQGQAAATSLTSEATTSPNLPARISSESRGKNIAVNYIIKFR